MISVYVMPDSVSVCYSSVCSICLLPGAMVAFEGVPIHSPYFAKLWNEVYNSDVSAQGQGQSGRNVSESHGAHNSASLGTEVSSFCGYSRLRMPGLSDKRFVPVQTCLYCQTAGCSGSLLIFIVRRSVSRSSFCLDCQNQTCLLLQFYHQTHNIQPSFSVVCWPGEKHDIYFLSYIFEQGNFLCEHYLGISG